MRCSSSILAAAVLTVVGLQAPATAAQETPRSSFGEIIEVNLVNVEVWVSDGQGGPVTGLTTDDFRVLHDGHEVAITHFTEVREGAAHAAAGTASEEPEGAAGGSDDAGAVPGHLIIYFDQLRLHPGGYKPLLEGLEKLLDAETVPPERVLILRQDRNLYIEAPFGSPRRRLDAALTRIAAARAAGVDLQTEMTQAMESIRNAWATSEGATGAAATGLGNVPSGPTAPGTGQSGGQPLRLGGGIAGSLGPDTCDLFLSRVGPIMDAWVRHRRERISITLAHLAETAGLLAGLPGVKSFLYLSDGLDAQPGAALATYAGSYCPRGQADLMMTALAEQLNRSLLTLTRHLNTHRVTVYSLQASGLQSSRVGSASEAGLPGGAGGRGAAAFESALRSSEREGLSLLARETGGRSVFNQNDLGPPLRRIAAEMQSHYSLAYELPAGGEGREHRIEVRLQDRSLQARYRRGYREADPGEWMAERVEGALTLGLVSNPLGTRLGAGEIRPGEAGIYSFPLHVIVPVEQITFLPAGGAGVAELSVRVVARNLQDQKLVTREERFRVKRTADAAQESVGLPLNLELGPGEHAVAVGLRDEGSGRASFVTTAVEIGR